jgi:hypothetical protein
MFGMIRLEARRRDADAAMMGNRWLNYGRLTLGFLLAPVLPAAIFAMLSVLIGDNLEMWYLKLGASIGYSAAVFFGIPLYFLVLSRKRLESLPVYVICGAAMGVGIFFLPLIAPVLWVGSTEGIAYAISSSLPFAFMSMLLGVLSASAFWLIAICGTTRK